MLSVSFCALEEEARSARTLKGSEDKEEVSLSVSHNLKRHQYIRSLRFEISYQARDNVRRNLRAVTTSYFRCCAPQQRSRITRISSLNGASYGCAHTPYRLGRTMATVTEVWSLNYLTVVSS